MTNGDKIRNMTDGELAAFLVSEDAKACEHCEYYDGETMRCNLDNPCVTELAIVMLSAWLSTNIVSERSENPCKDCDYFMITEKDFGCDFDGPCPYDREPDGEAES